MIYFMRGHILKCFIKLWFKWKKENCIWRLPFVISDKGFGSLSLNDVKWTKTEKHYKNAGWHVFYCLEIDEKIRKFESFAHAEHNLEKYVSKKVKYFRWKRTIDRNWRWWITRRI
jgi:hypothetical protein